MKKFLLPLLLLVMLPQILFAQLSKKEQNEEFQRNAKEIKMQAHIGTPSYISFSADYELTHEKAIAYSQSFCADNHVGFMLKNQQQSKDGKMVYKYEQTIAGIPVEFSAWHVHEKNGKVTALNGDIVDVENFELTFLISEEEALQIALNYIGAAFYMWMDEGEEQNLKFMLEDDAATYYPAGIKIITPVQPDIRNNKLTTAYKFNIYSKLPYDRKMVYVDAQTGEVLFDLPLIHFDNVVGTAHTQYYGEREINTFQNSATEYVLRDNTRGKGIRTLNSHMTTSYSGATEFFDDDNIWNNVNAQYDQYATDAHFATMATYDYYLNVHNRNSIDDNGFALLSYVHFNLVAAGYGNNINAFWNGQCMTYGDGNPPSITPLTTLDICGHEITHGLTEKTAGLIYSYESGALNEAYSDILGVSIDFYANPEEANWLMGDQIGQAFRSMSNPNAYGQPDTYHGTNWYYGSGDSGGVHTNSGVLNYWFYLLCEGGSGVNDLGNAFEVTPIGIENAEQLAYKTLTEYLTPNSQYIDACNYSLMAAGELFDGCSPEIQAIGDAFYAVGVLTAPYVPTTIADFAATNTLLCELPAQGSFINRTLNGISFLWDFGDGTTSTEPNPLHEYAEPGFYTVTLTVDGGNCGSDAITKENFIEVNPLLACNIEAPVNGHNTVQACAGVVYDCGGPNNNYPNSANSRLTIHAPDADHIVLTIAEFDIEPGAGSNCNYDYVAFYDGSSTAAPLINNTRYCNTTGNPGTITSTGEYITIQLVSDQNLTHAGYKILFHCEGLPLPEPDFSANMVTTCNGEIEFTAEATHLPMLWKWDLGDGTTSLLTTPNYTHVYAENGNYTVNLTVTNNAGENIIQKENYITVEIPAKPEIEDIKGCNDFEFEINLNLDGTACWYESMDSLQPVFIGNNWLHAPIDEAITYFLRERFDVPEGSVEEYCFSPFTEVSIVPEICLSIAQNHLEKIAILPNPSNGVFYIKGLASGICYKYLVTDITGRIIVEKQILNSERIDLSRFEAGIYFLTLSTSNGIKTYKLLTTNY